MSAPSSRSADHLLAVVEVEPEKRIRCQALGCGHTVYKRIHVVSVEGELQVVGSDCFKRLFAGVIGSKPSYGSSDGRRLTDEERKLLEQNTAELVAQLKAEHEDAERAAREKLRQIKQAMAMRDAARAQPIRAAGPSPALPRRQVGPTPEAIARYEAHAKADVRAKWGVDPDAPGWRGLVLQRIAEIVRQQEAQSGAA